jgi:3-hydroxyisobutyrate dehydrogenase-like beta-hydroxyacid dehydrogenase
MTKVGMIGAGRMGQPMIGHLARKGLDISVFDIDPGKRAAVEKLGGRWQPDAASLARSCEVILVCVGFDKELRELLAVTGPLRDAPKGTIIAVLATVQPATMVELAQSAAQRGVRVMDSTVCRGGKGADEGTLLSFVGGDAADFERLEPVLSCFCSDIVHTGPVGTAQVAKAANNMIMWSCLIANHEALALAQRHGMDAEKLREALLMSSGDNYVLRNWKQNTMAWAEDDMEIVQQMAAEKGIALPQAGVNREICRMLKPKRFKLDEYGV